ncbi:hypothetical protein BC834DRAFT_550349 [Gloeopeniophorella convolvens]|nr:hypothetical protein BC834DRAFT_550349 [Gloeopeniophorella convolvens]
MPTYTTSPLRRTPSDPSYFPAAMAHWSYGTSQYPEPHPGGFVDPSQDPRAYRYASGQAPTQGYAPPPPAPTPYNAPAQPSHYPSQPAPSSRQAFPNAQPTGVPSYPYAVDPPSSMQRSTTMPMPDHRNGYHKPYDGPPAPNMTPSISHRGAQGVPQYYNGPLHSVPETMDGEESLDPVFDDEPRYKGPPGKPVAGRATGPPKRTSTMTQSQVFLVPCRLGPSYCREQVRSDIAARYGGFCSTEHLEFAKRHHMVSLCKGCNVGISREHNDYCSDECQHHNSKKRGWGLGRSNKQ